jgi:hypothetical protein
MAEVADAAAVVVTLQPEDPAAEEEEVVAAQRPHRTDTKPWDEPDGAKGKDMVTGVLTSALDLARAAVSHDEQQAPPEKVLPYYEKAIQAIDTAIRLLPEGVVEKTGIRQHRYARALHAKSSFVAQADTLVQDSCD